MYRHTSRRRVVTPIVACAIGFLLGSCGSSPQQEVTSISYSCAAPPADLAGCSVDTDCMTVAMGCYCGAQPVNGVASKYATTARSCEDAAATSCARGCATEAKLVAQDGMVVDPGTILGAHCDHSGASPVCKSYLPPAGGGSGDPGSGGW